MKTMFFILSSFILFGINAQTQQQINIQDPNSPIMTFETEVIDYGTIKQGDNGEREFKFKNTGKSPLIITKAQGSCGCTVPTPPKEPILPGQSSVIKVKYDTKRVGPINKTITVTSNAKESRKVLRIKGLIKAPVSTPVKAPSTGAPSAK